MKAALFAALGVVAAVFLSAWLRALRRETGGELRLRPSGRELLVGFVTNFFDTLGIGSFAPTTAWYKLQHLVPDERIPGTLNVGHTPPVIVQAFIFIAIVAVDPVTLIAIIGAAAVGAWFGAGIVAGWPRRQVQLVMGVALLVAAGLFLMQLAGAGPAGGQALGLSGGRLLVALAGSVALGALMEAGIGFYAPCMILISVLGMDPRSAFPIMMGACAFLMPAGSLRFLARGSYARGAALGLALGGLPAVLIAAYLVRSLPLTALRWLVIAVVLYAAISMLRSARVERAAELAVRPT
jgi:uncharacterized membrane protein YfcA